MTVIASPVTRTRSAAPADLRWQSWYVRVLVVVDLLTAVLVLATAAAWAPVGPQEHIGTASPLVLCLLVVSLWSGLLASAGCYDGRYLGAGADEYHRVADASVRMLAVSAGLLVLTQTLVGPAFFTTVAVGLLLATAFARWLVRRGLHARRRSGVCLRRVLVVGDEAAERSLSRVMRRDPCAGYEVVARVDWTGRDRDPEALVQALGAWQADTVAVDHSVPAEQLRRVAWSLEGTAAELVVTPALTDIAGPRIHLRPVSGLPLLHVEAPDLDGGRQRFKHALDRVLALLGLTLLLPVFAVVVGLIRATSDGPALFRQQRLGKHGEVFSIVKFRTMYDGADERFLQLIEQQAANPGGMFVKERRDPRITPVGRWLRRFSVDELPQLLNVARGQMSLVGPRPLPTAVLQDGEEVRRRLLVRPGMTGLWQVSGRSDLPWDEAVRMDLYYVENWCLSFDLMILWRTVRAVALGSGAY